MHPNKILIYIKNALKQKYTSCEIKVRLITHVYSNLQSFLYSPIIDVPTNIYVGYQITFSLIYEMYTRSLYISHESTLLLREICDRFKTLNMH